MSGGNIISHVQYNIEFSTAVQYTIEGRYDDSRKTVGSKIKMYHTSRTKQIYK